MPFGKWKPDITDWSCYNPLAKAGFTWSEEKMKDLPESTPILNSWFPRKWIDPESTVHVVAWPSHY